MQILSICFKSTNVVSVEYGALVRHLRKCHRYRLNKSLQRADGDDHNTPHLGVNSLETCCNDSNSILLSLCKLEKYLRVASSGASGRLELLHGNQCGPVHVVLSELNLEAISFEDGGSIMC